MSKPEIHSQASAKKFGGQASDYIELNQFLDQSKSTFGDNRHRAILHHSFGVFILEQCYGIWYEGIEELRKKYNLPEEFVKDIVDWKDKCIIKGKVRYNSAGKKYSVRDVGEQHILEDFKMKFIPTVQDYLENMESKAWMQNGMSVPNSAKKLYIESSKDISDSLDKVVDGTRGGFNSKKVLD